MRMLKTLALSVALLASVPAMAQSGAVVGGAVGGSLNQSSLNGSFSFNGAGNGNAQSGSGFNATLNGSNGGAVFASQGIAGSVANATPFSSSSTSFHSGAAGGFATPNASFNASQVQNFGQGSANNSFDVHANADFSQSATSFQAAGVFGVLQF